MLKHEDVRRPPTFCFCSVEKRNHEGLRWNHRGSTSGPCGTSLVMVDSRESSSSRHAGATPPDHTHPQDHDHTSTHADARRSEV